MPLSKQLDVTADMYAFLVKVLGQEDRLAKALAELRRRYSGRLPPRLQGIGLGGVSVEELRIYPSPLPAPLRGGGRRWLALGSLFG